MTKKFGVLSTLAKRLLLFSLPVVAPLAATGVKPPFSPPPEMKETRVMSRALHFVKKNYVDPPLLDGERLLKKAFREMERGIAPLRIQLKEKSVVVSVGNEAGKIAVTPPITFDYLTPILRQVLGFLNQHYQGRVDEKDREYLALSGIIDALDPHSNFLVPKVFNEFKIGTKGNFGGLGIVIGIREGQLTVIAPIEGTPAYEMGIRSNDKIIQIGDEAAINMSLTEAVEKLRGPVGSLVSLVIQRSSSATPLRVTLKRALIQIKSVGTTLLSGTPSTGGGQAQGRVALIKIKNFQEDTARDVEKQLKKILSQNPKLKGVILDLRNDPGGLLDQSVAVADFFLSSGVIVKTVGSGHQTMEVQEAAPGDPFEKLPLVVLINEGSASAAEIVSGALQQNDRACVLGSRSFGKGSVQTVYDLKDGSALKLTIAKYLTANDYEVQSVGITPDINLIPISVGAKRVDLFENVKTREEDLENRGEEEEKPESGEPDSGKPDSGKPDAGKAGREFPSSRFSLKYLTKEKSEEGEDENAAKILLEQDTPVNLAEELLLLKEGNSRCSSFTDKEISLLLAKWESSEETKLVEALKGIGVSWTRPAWTKRKEGKPEAAVTIGLEDESGKPVKSLLPGQSGKIHMTVENRGSGPFYRLAAVTKSDDPLFSNLEFPFGEVKPGEKREWSVPLKIQEMSSERSEPVTFGFHEFNEVKPPSEEMDLTITDPPSPHFSYRYEIVDGDEKGTKGNKNGRPEKGETVGVKVTVKNEGPGESTKPVLNLRNSGEEPLFLEKGRVELDLLPPGGTAEGLLLVKLSTLEKVELELAVTDNILGETLADRLVWTPRDITPLPRHDYFPPKLTLEPNIPLLKTGSATYSLKGKVTDDGEVQHVFIFVNGEKVFYAPHGSNLKTLNFETSFRLKKGFNSILVEAQDDRDLTTQRSWIVWRR